MPIDPNLILQAGGIVVAIKAIDLAEIALRRRRNGKNGSSASNPGNGGLQRELGAMGARMEGLVDDLRDHNKESLSVQHDTLNAIKKLDENEDGRHVRVRKSIDEQTGIIAENTLEVRAMSGKVDKL